MDLKEMRSEYWNCPYLIHDGYEWWGVMNALMKDGEFLNGLNDY
jgi:hypothetical protein